MFAPPYTFVPTDLPRLILLSLRICPALHFGPYTFAPLYTQCHSVSLHIYSALHLCPGPTHFCPYTFAPAYNFVPIHLPVLYFCRYTLSSLQNLPRPTLWSLHICPALHPYTFLSPHICPALRLHIYPVLHFCLYSIYTFLPPYPLVSRFQVCPYISARLRLSSVHICLAMYFCPY